jgi:hypothetical protein
MQKANPWMMSDDGMKWGCSGLRLLHPSCGRCLVLFDESCFVGGLFSGGYVWKDRGLGNSDTWISGLDKMFGVCRTVFDVF